MLVPSSRAFSVLSRFKNELRKGRSALWLRPALLSVSAILLVSIVGVLDTLVGFPPLEMIGPDSLKDLLRFVAGGMLTVTTVTLSVLILVLSIAAGQASPRAVPELMADRVTQNALGTFLATFVFALIGLSFLEFGGVTGIGVTLVFGLALLLVALAVKYLVHWIHQVADTLKLHRIIERIHNQAQRVLDDYLSRSWEVDRHVQQESGMGRGGITADRAGYVQLIDVDKLDRLAGGEKISLDLAVREGDFVHPAVAVMTVRSNQDLDENLKASLRGSVVIGSERSAEGDPLLGFELLTEIACRALSPGINDPQSAITCTNYLGALLARAGAVSPDDYPPTESPCGRVALKGVAFQDMLKRAVRPVVRDGANCAEVICAVVDVLEELAELAATDYLPEIQAEAEAAADYASRRCMSQSDKDAIASQVSALKSDVRRRRG